MKLVVTLKDMSTVEREGNKIVEYPNDSNFMHFKIDRNVFKMSKQDTISIEIIENEK